jgi:hypothetical protein
MTLPHEEELRALQGRAYGPNADIHLDQSALRRLRELEGKETVPEPDFASETSVSDPQILEELDPLEQAPRRSLKELFHLLLGIRRSSILVVLAMVTVTAILVVALIVVQRVQTDPLQVGAIQIARLSADPAYKIPYIFVGAGSPQAGKAQSFQEFHGLRVVTTPSSVFGNGLPLSCMNVFPSAEITNPDANSFSGQVYSGCAAGPFPAIVQFTLDTPGLPRDLLSAFPSSAGLQFVYDRTHNEVVVFAAK